MLGPTGGDGDESPDMDMTDSASLPSALYAAHANKTNSALAPSTSTTMMISARAATPGSLSAPAAPTSTSEFITTSLSAPLVSHHDE